MNLNVFPLETKYRNIHPFTPSFSRVPPMISRTSKFETFLFLLPSSLFHCVEKKFPRKFPRSRQSGLWCPGNPLCRGYNQLNTSTPFNLVIVDTVHARTKGVVDFKLPLKLVSSRRNLIPSGFTYRERRRKREKKIISVPWE